MFILLLTIPILGSFFAGFFGRYLGTTGSALITTGCLMTTFSLAILGFYEVGLTKSPCYIQIGKWINIEFFDANWGFQFDSLTISMTIIVTLISSLVHLYSTEYMSHDPFLARFMTYLSLFTFFMLILISSDNFITMFLGWEGVGLCSYLLINFWYTRTQANKSAIKAMVINRIGDLGFAAGIILVFFVYKSINFNVIFALTPLIINESTAYLPLTSITNTNMITLICILLFIGAVGKSAQLGLHVWLPDAMEGPTPVSALIHAATMVTAGVFMIIRTSILFEHSKTALIVITIIGALTAFIASTIGLAQHDLKKVIAYSTCSQLGYMVFACGLSNYSVSMFHLMNHAYFKALLFLSAGSIIHALADEQDMRLMGGLRKILPFTYSVLVIGSLSLMGFPFLTGFYSKDLILELAYSSYTITGNFAHWLGTISAFFTAYYSFRLIYLTFTRNTNVPRKILIGSHEPTKKITIPLTILAICSIFIGYITKEMFIGIGTNYWGNSIFTLSENLNLIEAEFIPQTIKTLPVIFSIIGAFAAYQVHHTFKYNVYKLKLNTKYIFIFLNKKWFFDRIYNKFLAKGLLNIGYSSTYKLIDKGVIEYIGPYKAAQFIQNLSKKITNTNTGIIFHNTFFFLLGIVFFITILYMPHLFQNITNLLILTLAWIIIINKTQT